jgi:hypothetical protein
MRTESAIIGAPSSIRKCGMGLKELFKGSERMPASSDLCPDPSFDGLRFYSTASLERGLDGSEETFERFFYSIYHCMPDEPSGVSERREALRKQYPDKAIKISERRFVLVGVPAYQVLAAYYQALIGADTLSDDYRAYQKEHLELLQLKHHDSQSLSVPIDLTEGQLAHDERVQRYACIALRNRQIIEKQ